MTEHEKKYHEYRRKYHEYHECQKRNRIKQGNEEQENACNEWFAAIEILKKKKADARIARFTEAKAAITRRQANREEIEAIELEERAWLIHKNSEFPEKKEKV